MKNSLMNGALALLILVGIAACGSDDKGTEPVVEEAPAESIPAEEPFTAEEETTGEEGTTQVVVEESAAEPEDDEQPIMLARADSTEKPVQNWKYKEGPH